VLKGQKENGPAGGLFLAPPAPLCGYSGDMSDKLTEIMAHKRREVAPLLRPVFAD
jgi:hypothetical protein